jgi:predicted MFS family arabinose efflux permease
VLRSRIFLTGQAVSMLGNGLASLAIPLLVLQLTRSPVFAVLASLPAGLGYLVAGLPVGVLADRLDPWRMLVGADVTRTAVFLGLFVLTALHTRSVLTILALAFVAGAATVFFDTALAITVRDLFTGRGLIQANSWLESANQTGLIVGPGVAGLLAATGLLHLAMLIDALTFVASLASLYALRQEYRPARDAGDERRPDQPWRAFGGDLLTGLKALAATRLLFTLLLFLLVLNLCLGADKLIVFFARDTLRLSATQVGLVVTAGGVGGLIGAVGTSRLCQWFGPLRAVILCTTASGLALVLASTSMSMPPLLIANLLYSWAIVAGSVTLRALRQVLVPRHLLGRVTSTWRLAGQAVTILGALLAGTMTGLLGNDPRPVMAAAGVLTMLSTAAAWALGIRKQDTSEIAMSMLGK